MKKNEKVPELIKYLEKLTKLIVEKGKLKTKTKN